MLTGIEFNHERFKKENEYNLLTPITKNCIIICNSYKIMNGLAEEIINTVNGKAEYNNYVCDDEDIGKARYEIDCDLQKVIDINGQKITLALESAIVYKATDIEDIWFFDCINRNGIYEEFIYSITEFKSIYEIWDKGLDTIYKMVHDKYF